MQERLEPLPNRLRVAFGLSCCERMFPNYVAFKREVQWGDEQPLRKALDELWKYVEGETLPHTQVSNLINECESVAPDSESFSALLTGSAQDACFAICSVLDYILQENPERIAQTSAFAIDTIDLYVQELENMAPSSPGLEERIRLHPLMQSEIARQYADLELLAGYPDLGLLKAHWRAPGKSNIEL